MSGVRRLAGRLLPARVRARRAERRRRERAARGRAELLASDPALRAFAHEGATLIGRRVDRFTAAEAAEANLRLVAETAEAAGIEHFLVPGASPLRHVVGMRRADKKPFLSAMRDRHGATELYAGKPGEADALAAGPALYAEGALPRRVKAPKTMRFGRFLLGPDDQLIAGLEYGCDVEFWADGDGLADDPERERKLERVRVKVPGSMLRGAWIAPRPNRVADILPPEAREPASRVIGERKYPTFAPFNRRLVDDVDFPIDAVYMWVDGEDPEWSALRARHLHGDAADHTHLTGASRYTSRDELKYSLRSLHAFAPFIRNVYIVTAGQTPAWLDTDAPGIRVVDHAEIFADPSALPVFSSHAIATQLHRIPGLADHYLVLNDDVFFGRPSQAGQFFFPNGLARLPFSPLQIGLGATRPEDSAPNSAGKNVRRLLEAEFGRFITGKFKHLPHPQLRQVAFEMEERYAAPVAATARSRFRDPADIEFAAMLHHHYAMLTGRAVPGNLKLRYVDISHADAAEQLDALAEGRDAEFFCLNDVDTPPELEAAVGGMVRRFLDHYLPFPSPYERA
ncbi:MAG TPA: stealth family protein [Glycomyces sp.]|nr:stealth family protein [Glycomyces sp.]